MNSKKMLIVAVVLGIVAVIAVNLYVRRVETSYTSDQIVVYRAKAALTVGKPVNMKNVEKVTLSRKAFGSASKVAVTERDAPLLQAAVVAKPIGTGDILLFTHFDRAIDGGLRERIPAGMRAMSISVSEAGSVGYFVQPGDRVDVMGTMNMQEQLITRTILEDVQVLAVGGHEQPDSSAFHTREGYSTVTLAVTPPQAEKLIFSRNLLEDSMTLLLRRPDDRSRSQNTEAINAADPQQYAKVK
ncbi:MAG: Flp pilus assembly protein CpaB [Acidobacteria bacterium]|nr:MAG: Flp pilus assembly protein CpaB [Acidobacteriota bacterium]